MSQQAADQHSSMRWSLKIGEVAGIGIFIHWTFAILIAWIAMSHYSATQDWSMAIRGVVFVLAIFGCVVLHELGHALTARRYGIRTRDITLLPIGGVASLERMPEDPRQELAIAVAGPAVNVVIAAVLFVVISVTGRLPTGDMELEHAGFVRNQFLANLLWVNIVLVIFNLIPAFPMDGGRVLRALLATKMDYARATQIAATVGQGLAVLLGFFGLFSNVFLVFIAIFVYLGAEAEAQMATLRSAFRDVPVREAMMTRFRTLAVDDPVEVAISELLAGSQHDFPVVSAGQVVGLLPRTILLKSLAEGNRTGRIGDIMQQPIPVVEESAPLDRTFEKMREAGVQSIPVVQGGTVVGMLTLENIGEWAMVQSALRDGKMPEGLAAAMHA